MTCNKYQYTDAAGQSKNISVLCVKSHPAALRPERKHRHAIHQNPMSE
jgi:hypothetical protein